MATNRLSTVSGASTPVAPRSTAQHSTQVSTTTLLNALHTTYASAQPYRLDASTSLVVNTWLTAFNPNVEDHQGGTVDGDLARQAWEHARRRAEDGCVVLGSLHPSTPSLLSPVISTLPLAVPSSLYTSLAVLRPFLNTVTPFNPTAPKYAALAVAFKITLAGNLNSASLSISSSGIDTNSGLLRIPPEAGYRAFDVFYYLLTSASTPAEREFLGLKHPSAYTLLNQSGTFAPPSYLPTADDTASAEDFRASLKAIGIKGPAHRSLLSTLAGLLKLGETTGFLVDEEILEETCEDVGGLLGLEPEVLLRRCSTNDRETLIAGVYEALVDWVLGKSNEAIAAELQRTKDGDTSSESGSGRVGERTPRTEEDNGDTVTITIVEIPRQDLGKALALRGVFDDTLGINAEMREDGVEVIPAGSSVAKDMHNAVAEVAVDLGVAQGLAARDRDHERDRREAVLEKVGLEAEVGGFLRKILYPEEGEGIRAGIDSRLNLPDLLGSTRVWYQLALHPTDESPGSLASLASTTSAWSAGTVSRQLRAWRLPEWANRRNKNLDFTADFDIDEFCERYARLGCHDGRDGVESWILERGWSNGEVVVGEKRVWIREGAWWEAEGMLDLKPVENPFYGHQESGYSTATPDPTASGFFPPMAEQDPFLRPQQSTATLGQIPMSAARSVAPTVARTVNTMPGDYGLGAKGDDKKGGITYYDDELGQYINDMDPEIGEPKAVVSQPIPKSRRAWIAFVWALTFWIPSFLLRYVGRMKRPDIRFAWREKIVLFLLIFLLNGIVVFWIVEFGHLLCPNMDKAWNQKEVGYHTGDNDFWVSIHGAVYDISKFWKLPHSDIQPQTTAASMQPFAGLNLDAYFPPPLTQSCPHLVSDDFVGLLSNDTTVINPVAKHTSGPRDQPNPNTALHSITWYQDTFVHKIKEFYKGDLVTTKASFQDQGQNQGRQWVMVDNAIYDLTDYFHTLTVNGNDRIYKWLPDDVAELIQGNPGVDITNQWKKTANFSAALQCMQNTFYAGKSDFRYSAKCQVNNYILLAFTIILCTVILTKFLAALQLGSKRRPAAQDKFVICQVPAYTEGEDHLRKGLDSLTALQYDNKRKLICVMCDGMIVGGGNDRPTPKIVLDILGVDPKIDPPALPFKSVGQSNEQLNYGKVYSGLYEFEGNVVPYIVVVKVGKESEQTKPKPGNRGKRDSQILLLSFLNRVHHRAPMSPLELEMFHQINNIIGVDPELYEYLLMVDADTSVKEDSLNRLVASCANDAKIAGICGETSLENEGRSWWTMIQVYEYYISHHLAKAFESLFGSVTCLPGCFCMYRLRTADKGRPLVISDQVITEYATCDVDTLHKKNLLSLGEDRYLTTLMTKHFPSMSYKFISDAYASTAAPETWGVLISQRRRWINSTVHNLAELVWLKDLCGFCCFSMRFVVFIDLFGTIILPATCGYLGYLIYRVATHSGQFPLISIVMIAAVYGLQAIIFIIKRQWQHIGWMIIYILAFPIYTFVLPIFSFWHQDDFAWGNTRVVLGEKGNKQIVALEDEGFDPRSIPLQRWDDYAAANNLPGRRGMAGNTEKSYQEGFADAGYEMDDIRSMYSSVKPASTVLTGFHNRPPAYMPPVSPAPFYTPRQSQTPTFVPYTDNPQYAHSRMQSMGNVSDQAHPSPYGQRLAAPSQDNLISMHSPPLRQSRSPLGGSRPVSMIDFRGTTNGPDDGVIVEAIQSCLAEVDLDNVTKKQVRALVEQRLQTELVGDKKAFLDRQIDIELENMYTASDAFFEALWEAGITHCFVNLGSDHPSILEAIIKGQSTRPTTFPRIITCPNEMVALSMADGYARLSGQPQCVIVHVDVGTQGLGAAVHNASCGRCPVLIFAGLSPLTDQGEYRGSRTEFIHWIQDVPDQKAIVAQYCRYTAEIKTGRNVKQMVARAVQFATSAPQGPVYLCGAREVMEEDIPEYSLRREKWGPVGPGALPEQAVEEVVNALVEAEEPLVITGYSGRNHDSPAQLVALADSIPGLRVLDTGGSDMCFPATHQASLGLRYGVDAAIPTADMILVLDCDVPWIPTQNAPNPTAKVYHIDIDPLKMQMPVGWIESHGTWRADSFTALRQLNAHIASSPHHLDRLSSEPYSLRRARLSDTYTARQAKIHALAVSNPNNSITTSYLTSRLRALLPPDTIFAVEAVTNSAFVADALRPSLPGTWLNCGGGGLGWSGGAALGIKLAAGASRFVCQIVADGTFLFSVPGSVYWIAQRYNLPVLTIVLNNNGWHAPRRSLLLVHPEGRGSRVSDEELNISFRPSPDYAGIAVAAAGGRVWGARAEGWQDLERLLWEAIRKGEGAKVGVAVNGEEEADGEVQDKGDDVLEAGAEERGGGKAVLVG